MKGRKKQYGTITKKEGRKIIKKLSRLKVRYGLESVEYARYFYTEVLPHRRPRQSMFPKLHQSEVIGSENESERPDERPDEGGESQKTQRRRSGVASSTPQNSKNPDLARPSTTLKRCSTEREPSERTKRRYISRMSQCIASLTSPVKADIVRGLLQSKGIRSPLSRQGGVRSNDTLMNSVVDEVQT
ncbi:hypothetical protein BSKO_06317 [Bryopsis sp. KO-2023]|nr:hypothetical protein BSKO_06317 [Bryopsis sp. KO-2023]